MIKTTKTTGIKITTYRVLKKDGQGQLIMLMGFTLVFAVMIIGAISSEISDIDVLVPQRRSSELVTEFIYLKDTFGTALNYQLATLKITQPSGELPTLITYEGDLYGSSVSAPLITTYVSQTSNYFRALEFTHNMVFSATYKGLDYSHRSLEGDVYYVQVTLSLKDDTGLIIEPVVYSVVCKAPQVP